MPAVFAFADNVIQDQQTTVLSAFGSFAILVLADFGGPRRTRLGAYLALTVGGAALITLGTLCSQTPWLAVVAMAVVGFLILLSGVISGYFAAARIAALLTFILPVSIPAPPSAIPPRLEGWALAASVGICALMLLWPSHPRDRLRAGAARATRALADLVDSELSGDPSTAPMPRTPRWASFAAASSPRHTGRPGRRAPARRLPSWSTSSTGCSRSPLRLPAGRRPDRSRVVKKTAR
jgi:uncharacterized membrane protein YccC